jgi:predicted transcriptional regulator
MRYSLNINQPVAIELGLENTTEAIIFDYLIIAPTWAKPIIIANQVYYWVARQKICDEHPLLDLKTDTVYRYLKRLGKKGLITYIKQGKKDCISITKAGKKYVSKAMSENNPSAMSEKNPNNLGELSELARKKIRHINIPPYAPTNDSLSKRGISNFDSFVSYIRAHFKNQLIIETIDKWTKKPIEISVSDRGMLYDKKTSDDFQAPRAKELWSNLYQLALDEKLSCLQEEIA